MQKELKLLLDCFIEGDSIQPILLTESDLIDSLNYLNSSNIFSIDELRHEIIPNVYLFETEEKSFKIEKSRELIQKASVKPELNYSIFIIREIDKFTDQAANSLLKLLEDVPPRVIFLLTTNAKENIIATITSRILYFGSDQVKFEVTTLQKELIDDFFYGNKLGFIKYILNQKLLRHECIGILEYILIKLKNSKEPKSETIKKTLEGIQSIYSTNVNTKYILDMVILDL